MFCLIFFGNETVIFFGYEWPSREFIILLKNGNLSGGIRRPKNYLKLRVNINTKIAKFYDFDKFCNVMKPLLRNFKIILRWFLNLQKLHKTISDSPIIFGRQFLPRTKRFYCNQNRLHKKPQKKMNFLKFSDWILEPDVIRDDWKKFNFKLFVTFFNLSKMKTYAIITSFFFHCSIMQNCDLRFLFLTETREKKSFLKGNKEKQLRYVKLQC